MSHAKVMKQSSRPRGRTAVFPSNDEGLVHRTEVASGLDEVRRIQGFGVVTTRVLLRQANRVQTSVRFEVRYVGPSSSLQTSIGITLAGIETLPQELPRQSWVVLAGDVEHVMLCGGAHGPGKSADDEAAEKVIETWLKSTVRPGHKVISICTGGL